MVDKLNEARAKLSPGSDLTSSQIISLLEKLGMSPPPNKVTKSGSKFGYEHEYQYWEPENETLRNG